VVVAGAAVVDGSDRLVRRRSAVDHAGPTAAQHTPHGGLHDKFLRHRYAKAVRDIGDRYRAGELDAAPAGAAVSAELREFLRFVTGVRAEYMQLDDIADSALAPAAPLLAELSDAQFNDVSHVDVGLVSADAEELIRSWT